MELSRKSLGLYFHKGDTERRKSRMIYRLGEEQGEENLEVIPASRGSVMHWKLAANTQSGQQSCSGVKEVIFIGRKIRKENFCWNDSAQTNFLWPFTALSLCLGKKTQQWAEVSFTRKTWKAVITLMGKPLCCVLTWVPGAQTWQDEIWDVFSNSFKWKGLFKFPHM